MDKEAHPSKKVKIDDQNEVSMEQIKTEGMMILFTCLRVSQIMGRVAEIGPFQCVQDAKHILAEAIGAKECSCNMCMCDVLQENSLLRQGGLN